MLSRPVRHLVVVAFLLAARSAAADDGGSPLAPNSIYVEGFGAGIAYSINYERLVTPDVGVRIGWSQVAIGEGSLVCDHCSFLHGDPSARSDGANMIVVPITASYVGWRRGRHVLETGGGVSLAYAWYDGYQMPSTHAAGAFMTMFAGYRFQPRKAGCQFRIGAIAYPGMANAYAPEVPVSFWGYVSVGAAF